MFLAGDGSFRVASPSAKVREALAALSSREGVTEARLVRLLGQPLAEAMLTALDARRLTQRTDGAFPRVRGRGCRAYFDALLPDPARQRQLRDVTVLIVGCGALGGELARHCACSGVGRLLLVDRDVVERSNLNRQYLFTVEDVGRPKLEVAAAALRRAAPQTQVLTYTANVMSARDLMALRLPAIDAAVCCADTPPHEIGAIVSEYATARGALFAMATVGIENGLVGPLMPPDAPVPYHDWLRARPSYGWSLQLAPTIPSFGPTNSLIAALLARDLLHVFAGDSAVSLGARVNVDFRAWKATRIPLRAARRRRKPPT